MRPYKIPRTNTWVDLDTIQSIEEPCGYSVSDVTLAWHHAFMDKPRWVDIKNPNIKNEYDWNERREYLKEIHKEVFQPFFDAWTGKS